MTESRMIQGGLPLVLSQTFRALIQSRMQIGIGKYATEYPQSSILLVEPNRSDERMFFTNMFSYSSRSELAEHAYRSLVNSRDSQSILISGASGSGKTVFAC